MALGEIVLVGFSGSRVLGRFELIGYAEDLSRVVIQHNRDRHSLSMAEFEEMFAYAQ